MTQSELGPLHRMAIRIALDALATARDEGETTPDWLDALEDDLIDGLALAGPIDPEEDEDAIDPADDSSVLLKPTGAYAIIDARDNTEVGRFASESDARTYLAVSACIDPDVLSEGHYAIEGRFASEAPRVLTQVNFNHVAYTPAITVASRARAQQLTREIFRFISGRLDTRPPNPHIHHG